MTQRRIVGQRPQQFRPACKSAQRQAAAESLAKGHSRLSSVIVGHGGDIRRPDPARDRAAWRDTALHLRSRGLPVVVPELIGAWLRRQGIRPDWTTS